MTDEVVTRLYRALVEELRRRGHPEGRPVKVSELYQTIVPYRAVRGGLGVELNADYEHALLRLLAGERNLLRLEPAQAREELRNETEAPYPFVGLFRKFSASNVWVTMPDEPAEPAEPAEPPQPVQRPVAEPAADAAPPAVAAEAPPVRLSGGGGADPAPARPPVHLHAPGAEAEVDGLSRSGTACAFCGDDLPTGRRVRFCPHCGGDQRLRPCPRCEAVLEREWRYCISCGNETTTG